MITGEHQSCDMFETTRAISPPTTTAPSPRRLGAPSPGGGPPPGDRPPSRRPPPRTPGGWGPWSIHSLFPILWVISYPYLQIMISFSDNFVPPMCALSAVLSNVVSTSSSLNINNTIPESFYSLLYWVSYHLPQTEIRSNITGGVYPFCDIESNIIFSLEDIWNKSINY